ncbi:lytic transglycosylase domain-containing protein [Mesorhizobium sp. PUT5]|uniref:lytic transglycosylase domain-containing protein n=1 Tax=Mesorhizobium sp. PUT5 TaxID=3454629 RepID=UPI003FA4A548
MGVRDGGSCAAVRTVTAMLAACAIVVVTAAPASADPPRDEAASAVASTPDGSSRRSPVVVSPADPWAAHITDAARRFDVSERWIRAVMAVESVNGPAALSPKGAIGLMQVMPATWDELRAKHGLGDDPWRPRDNILAGTAYLREMHDRYGSVSAMLAAYNAGPGRYDSHLATGRPLPAETVDYVAKIMPMIDGTGAVARSAGRPAAPSWSRAPLFAGRSNVQNEDDPASAGLPFGSRPDASAIVDLSALGPPSDGLFVPRSAQVSR